MQASSLDVVSANVGEHGTTTKTAKNHQGDYADMISKDLVAYMVTETDRERHGLGIAGNNRPVVKKEGLDRVQHLSNTISNLQVRGGDALASACTCSAARE